MRGLYVPAVEPYSMSQPYTGGSATLIDAYGSTIGGSNGLIIEVAIPISPMMPVIPSSYIPDTNIALVIIQEPTFVSINVRYSSTISPWEIERYFNGQVHAIYDGSGQRVIWSTLDGRPLPGPAGRWPSYEVHSPDTSISSNAITQVQKMNKGNCPEDEEDTADEDECSKYRKIPLIFAFSDGTQITNYDLSFNVGIVYRGLAAGENPTRGLFARLPGNRTGSPRSHNAGLRLSPWISTSKSAEKVTKFNRGGHGIVAIDLARVDTIKVDLSQAVGLPARGRFRSAAIYDEEVLILDCVSSSAIVH